MDLDVGVERLAIHELVDYPRCGHPTPQPGDGGLRGSVPERRIGFNRTPRRARPRRRVILVVVPVSPRKTGRWISWRMRGWRSREERFPKYILALTIQER